MAAKLTNKLGALYISDSVIAKLAGISATECFGVVGLASGDGLSDLLKKDSVDKGVRVTSNAQAVSIELNLIVLYGVSIPATSNTVIETVRYFVERCTGMNVETVNVVIRGIRVE